MPSRRLPTVQQRLARLEDALVALLIFSTDGQPSRVERSVGGSGGTLLTEFLAAWQAEKDLREAGEDPAA
jgi:hypothetical protein